jgi:hypothetical protein
MYLHSKRRDNLRYHEAVSLLGGVLSRNVLNVKHCSTLSYTDVRPKLELPGVGHILFVRTLPGSQIRMCL